jgi:hypothetical protein
MKLWIYIRQTLEQRLNDASQELINHYNDKWRQYIGGYNGLIHQCPISDRPFFNCHGRNVLNSRGRNVFVYADHVDYWECACCAEDYLNDDVESYSTEDGDVCESCYSDNYVSCQSCGESCATDNCEYDDDSCEYTCNQCLQRQRNVIDGYHSRRNESTRSSWLNKAYRDQVLFGVELEILSNRDQSALQHISSCAKAQGFLAERDGSLDTSYGVEIIAPPLSIENCSKQWQQFLDNIAGNARGWQAGTGYGMHVSFSRKTLTNLHSGKLMMFVHQNQNLCEQVAGRSANEWCKYRPKKIGSGAYDNCWEKYEALANRGNYRWEMRIFRSTLKHSGFMRNVEFVKACIDFTKQAQVKATEEDFKAWLFLPANRKSYPNLFNHIFDSYRAINVMKLQRHNAKQSVKI